MSYAEKSKFKTLVSKITDRGIIGLDYMIEVHMGDTFESNLQCVLCGDMVLSMQLAVGHLSTYEHRMEYLEKHFPTAFDKIAKMEKREKRLHFLEKVCQSIEDKYGRLSEKVVKSTEFAKNQLKFIDEVANANHIDENWGQSFIELFTESEMKAYIPDFEDYDGFDATSITKESSTFVVKSSGVVSKGSSPSLSPNGKSCSFGVSLSNSKRNPKYNEKRHYLSNNSYNSYRRKYASSEISQVKTKSETRTRSPRSRSRSPQRKSTFSIRSPNNYERSYKSYTPSQSYKNEPSTSQIASRNSVETSNLTTSSRVKHETNYSSANQIYSRRRYYDTASSTELFERRKPAEPYFDKNVSIDEPVTVMPVLSLLTAFEDILGSLGPKVIDLITVAITMNKVKANSSNLLLDNHEHSITFETIHQKLNGLWLSGSIEPNKIPTVRKAIDNMATLIDEANKRTIDNMAMLIDDANETIKTNKLPYVPVTEVTVKTKTSLDDQSSSITEHDRAAIAGKIVLALINQGNRKEDFTRDEINNYVEQYIMMANAKHLEMTDSPQASTASLAKTLYDPPEVLPLPSDKTFDARNHLINRQVLPMSSEKKTDAVNKNQLIHRRSASEVLPIPLEKTFDARNEKHSNSRHDHPKIVSMSSENKIDAVNESQSLQQRNASKDLPMLSVNTIDLGSKNHLINRHGASEDLNMSSVNIDARNTKQSTNRHEKGGMLKEFSPTNLSDSDLKNLVINFTLLSDKDKESVIGKIKEIEKKDPERMKNFAILHKNEILNSMCYKTVKEHKK